MISALSMALVLAAKLGLDPAMVIEVIQSGMFASPLYAAKTAKILAGDFSPDFSLALMLKDQEMVLETGRALGLTLPTVERIRDVLARAVEAGLGKLDPSALIQLYEVEAGIAVRNTITADRETL
jgi:3-hydroxyisobutyrate dehydrogenase-like beta-hydroxyacid dehydrogenase